MNIFAGLLNWQSARTQHRGTEDLILRLSLGDSLFQKLIRLRQKRGRAADMLRHSFLKHGFESVTFCRSTRHVSFFKR